MHCPWLLKRDPKTTTMQNISTHFIFKRISKLQTRFAKDSRILRILTIGGSKRHAKKKSTLLDQSPTCFYAILFFPVHFHKNLYSCRTVAKDFLHLWITGICLKLRIKTICYSIMDLIKKLDTIWSTSTIFRKRKTFCRWT